MTDERIEAAALNLLQQHKLLALPINVREVAKVLEIRVLYEDLEEDISGFLVIKKGNATIVVNSRHHPNRQRFTIAHECGHFVLHAKKATREDRLFVDRKYPLYRQPNAPAVFARSESFAGDYEEERQANRFAASLLMPEPMVRGYLAQNKIDLSDETDSSRLAFAFGVSEQAMSIRLMNLGLAVPA